MLIRDAELAGRGRCDVRLADGRVEALGHALEPRPGESRLDAAGGALLPGLHDHHIHLLALAAALSSLRCGPPQVRDAAALAAALREAPLRDGWLRGVGYHESVAGPLDRHALDAWRPDAPVRVQHRSGALWMLNTAAVARLGLDTGADAVGVERDARGRATGRLLRLDGWLRERLGARAVPDLAPVGAALAACGVTGVTDATPGNGAGELALFTRAVRARELPQRVVLMGSRKLPPVASADAAGLARGAFKRMLFEAALPDPDALADEIAGAHAEGRAVAIHCATRTELVLALAGFAAAGARAGDRIEHASVAPPELVRELAALPLTVVTQPNFVHERGDAYLEDVEERDLPWLYRCRGWLEAGVPLAAGTDAPFGEPDPWRAMRAAVERRSEAGRCLGREEALDPERALALFTTRPEAPGGAPRRVAPGEPADLCLLSVPWREARGELSSRHVRVTFRAGEPVWRRDPG